ncbi:TetR/AcrR family transcriptional regulator C-terminal domain-containing protein [Nakamurella sp. PAMC28650]|uniref:TetR/AcrR family transcriptional regulator C-terminal domain-containing protein n=1 Tax=Nakamurella sp. PAMC28650 TaxID=2762325 RepID=UPI00164D9B14|nr:TetR/AcrR family transcriptional regulator C-terminal domain-containing protein [Nakamurella sp. PAMC28650]QNK82099.1 TetR/AcrR family transcriptional regulator C-terminal domain-containing protein [Nakamurella sp. PAMC28650]
MERFLRTLHDAGFSDRAAVSAYRAFSCFLLGHLLLEVTALGSISAEVGRAEPQPAPPVYLSDYPHLDAIQAELTRPYTDDEFEEALESLLDRLESQGLT